MRTYTVTFSTKESGGRMLKEQISASQYSEMVMIMKSRYGDDVRILHYGTN